VPVGAFQSMSMADFLARVGRIDRSTCGVFSRLDADLYEYHPRRVIAYAPDSAELSFATVARS
jgi:hypothetical protein